MVHKKIYGRMLCSLVLGFSTGLLWGCGEDAQDDDSNDTENDEPVVCAPHDDTVLPVGTTWQWQLTSAIDHAPNVDMYDVDLFDVAAAEISTLQAEGRFVVCYFSAGSWESWREDADQFAKAAIGKTMEDWADEKWLDIRHQSIRQMVESRIALAAQKGCDGVEPDNVDGYVNDTGFPLTGSDQLRFNQFIAETAHASGLSVGLKNDVDQLGALVDCFDWALNEECFAYDECHRYQPFIAAGKAVFHVEYVDNHSEGAPLAGEVCGDASIEGFSTLIKDWDLTSWLLFCP